MTCTTNANPYRHRRQRCPDVGDEVQANIAEYAVMHGLDYEHAECIAKQKYSALLASIHRVSKTPT